MWDWDHAEEILMEELSDCPGYEIVTVKREWDGKRYVYRVFYRPKKEDQMFILELIPEAYDDVKEMVQDAKEELGCL